MRILRRGFAPGAQMLLTSSVACSAMFLMGYAFHATQSSAVANTSQVAMSANGIIESTEGGFKFPDGSVQLSAANKEDVILAAAQALTLNTGLYNNRIPLFTPPLAYVEFCFKNNNFSLDDHPASSSTEGGNCQPGDTGWIIEKSERAAATWTTAKAECLKLGMRLPEFFEYQLSCRNAASVSISDMTNNSEWASNTATMLYAGGPDNGIVSAVTGYQGCARADIGWAARADHLASQNPYRCSL